MLTPPLNPLRPPTLPRFYRKHRRALVALAQSVTHDPALAEDAVQTAMLNLLQSPRLTISTEEKLRNLAVIAVKNAAKNLMRSRRREQQPDENDQPLADWPDQTPGPAALCEQAALTRLLASRLQLLPEADRDILLLKYVNECTVAQIAQLLGLPVETVKKRLQRARAKLKQGWEADLDE